MADGDTPLFLREFPDFDDPGFKAPEDFEDGSWGNEQCPLFFDDENGLMLGVDYVNPENREFPEGGRFSLHDYARSGARSGPRLVAVSDDLADMEALAGRVRDVAAVVAQEGEARLDGQGELSDLADFARGPADLRQRFLDADPLILHLRQRGVVTAGFIDPDAAVDGALYGLAASCWRGAQARLAQSLDASAPSPGM